MKQVQRRTIERRKPLEKARMHYAAIVKAGERMIEALLPKPMDVADLRRRVFPK